MRALTVSPGIADSARIDDIPEPPLSDGSILARALALGVCATDREILLGVYGSAPPGEQRLVLGHESLGVVEAAPRDCGLSLGDLVVGIVRRPDPEPCIACALLVTGAGPIGLLAALMGAQRGLAVHVLDHNAGGAKEELVRGLGGTYHSDAGTLDRLAPDILMECTGAPSVIKACLGSTARAGITCLAGVTEPGKMLNIDIGRLNRTMVLDNDCVFGSVNANRRHYELAAQALARADENWLRRLITRRVRLERWSEATRHRPGDIKVIIEFAHGGHAVPY